MLRLSMICLLSLLSLVLPQSARADDTTIPDDHWLMVMDPHDSLQFLFAKGSHLWGDMQFYGMRPKWIWAPPISHDFGANGILDVTVPFITQVKTADLPEQSISIHERVQKTGPNSVTLTYTLSADGDRKVAFLTQEYSMIGSTAGLLACYQADGVKAYDLPLPMIRIDVKDTPIGKLEFNLKNLGQVILTIDPPISTYPETNQMRLPLLMNRPWAPSPEKGLFSAGTKTYTFTYTFPGPVDFYSSKEEIAKLMLPWTDDSWYPLSYANDIGPSVIGMEDWMDAPAGKHGHLHQVDNRFVFADGTPMKLWGVTLMGPNCYPPKNRADFTAARYAKYGVNCLRFNQFIISSWTGFGDKQDSTKFNPALLDRMDYYTDQLKKHGVYYGWMHTWDFFLHPADKPKLLAYDEIVNNLGGKLLGLIQVAPDVQDLMIEMLRNLLTHKNPYTGMTYAEDPALAFVECINEDDVFFWSVAAVDKCPTYKKQLEQSFASWLKERYATPEAWKQAWGGAVKNNESLDGQVGVQTNPWFAGSDGLAQMKNNPGQKRRTLDNAAFLHHLQNAFYAKFIKAVRDTGYQGPIQGSNWWAETMVPHMYNLKSDAMCGWVDRHNYWGGDGNLMFASLLSDPGNGYLSSGLQQVVGAVFTQSEWTTVYPSTYSAEGPPLMAAYGLGLQGWSGVFQHVDNDIGYDPTREIVGTQNNGIWNVERPSFLGQYPTLARMISRGDVKEGDIVSVRRVSDDNLRTGVFDFFEETQAGGDMKDFKSSAPREALAAGKMLVEFTGDKNIASTLPDMSKYRLTDKVIQSTTKQLTWDYTGKGYILINTPGTRGVVGFTPDTPHQLGNVTITVNTPYASVLITALEKDKTLDNCTHALVSIVSRESNTGFKYLILNNSIVDNGKPPMLMEPVKSGIRINGRAVKAVNVLDFDGRRQTDKSLAVGNDGQFSLDTGKDHTMYYEVVFK